MPDTHPTPLRALTLFAGAGGADVGLADAGFEHVRCIEYDAHAHATLCAAGFPGVLGDVRDPTLYADLGRIDLMWASPPCQDWSSAGKREGASGERNGWPWTWDAVDLLRRQGSGPTWLVCENVTGMLTHNGAACGSGCCADPERCPATYWHEVVMREARERFAWADYRVLDAADYGTPQFRRRVFLVAGPRPIRWPEPTHGEPTAQRSMFGPALKPWVTVREALGLSGVFGGGTRGHGMAEWQPAELDDRPAACVTAMQGSTAGLYVRTEQTGATATPDTMPAVSVGSGLKGSEWTADLPSPCVRDGNGTSGIFIRTEQTGATATPDTMPAPTVPTVGNQYLHSRDPGTRAASEPDRLDRPAPTVTSTEVKGTRASAASGGTFNGGPDRASDALYLATGRRRLSVLECAALFSMPPDYPWQGTMTSKYRQIGNMCAWKVVAALGRAVAEAAT